METAALLGRNELLAALGKDAIEAMAASARELTLERGDLLFAQDEVASDMFVVRAGRVSIARRSRDGRLSVVALMEEEDLFGEMGLFDGRGRSAEARALEPSAVVAVDYGVVKAALEARPEALWTVVSLLAGRLRVTDEALADSVFLDVTGRTAKRLLELAGASDQFVLPVTQEELAGLVGASRERVNKAIATFLRLGWLVQEDRRYRIVNREELARRAM